MTLEQLAGRPTTHKAALVDHCPYCGHNLLVCRVPKCDRASRARGLCKGHYGRLMRYGSVAADVPLRTWRGS